MLSYSRHTDASKMDRERATCRDFMFGDMLAAIPPSIANTYADVRDALIADGSFSVPSACDIAHDVVKARAETSALEDAVSTLSYLVRQYDYNRRLDDTNMVHVRSSLANCRAAIALNTRSGS